MDKEDFKKLKFGDVIRNKGSGNSYVVVGNYGERMGIIVTRPMLIHHPDEWEKVENDE